MILSLSICFSGNWHWYVVTAASVLNFYHGGYSAFIIYIQSVCACAFQFQKCFIHIFIRLNVFWTKNNNNLSKLDAQDWRQSCSTTFVSILIDWQNEQYWWQVNDYAYENKDCCQVPLVDDVNINELKFAHQSTS